MLVFPSPLEGEGAPKGRIRGFEPCRRQIRSGGANLGEKAMRAKLEWRALSPSSDAWTAPNPSPVSRCARSTLSLKGRGEEGVP